MGLQGGEGGEGEDDGYMPAPQYNNRFSHQYGNRFICCDSRGSCRYKAKKMMRREEEKLRLGAQQAADGLMPMRDGGDNDDDDDFLRKPPNFHDA